MQGEADEHNFGKNARSQSENFSYFATLLIQEFVGEKVQTKGDHAQLLINT